MKRLIGVLLLMICVCSISYATDNSYLGVIADKLDVSEEQAFETLVYQQKIAAYRNLITVLLAVIAGFIFIKTLKAGDKSEKVGYNGREWKARYILPAMLTGLYTVSATIYNAIMLEETFTGLFNPEYGALEQLKFITSG